jgi:hypothetical protein
LSRWMSTRSSPKNPTKADPDRSPTTTGQQPLAQLREAGSTSAAQPEVRFRGLAAPDEEWLGARAVSWGHCAVYGMQGVRGSRLLTSTHLSAAFPGAATLRGRRGLVRSRASAGTWRPRSDSQAGAWLLRAGGGVLGLPSVQDPGVELSSLEAGGRRVSRRPPRPPREIVRCREQWQLGRPGPGPGRR